MTTLAPQITPNGISGPSYADILAQLQNMYWSIYGTDAVIGPNTQDGQFLAIFAQAIYDTGQACIAVYNSFSPKTAQGSALSNVVAINGLIRNESGNSTVTISIGGVAGTIIYGGIVGDNLGLGTQWALPSPVTIPGGGTINVTASCNEPGAVSAAANSLTQILTPTLGWQTANNAAAATVGAAVESDAALRTRQAASAGLPALTVLQGIYAAVGAVSGVQEVIIYENDTDTTDGAGRPAHSITAVVQGGSIAAIAQAIYTKKSPGTTTYGTTSFTIIDQFGVPDTINFYLLSVIPITVSITLTHLAGYVTTTATLIAKAVAAYISGLSIGENVYLNRLFAAANLSGDAAVNATGYTQAQLDVFSATYNVTAILQARSGSPSASDVTIAFNEQASCVAGTNVTVT